MSILLIYVIIFCIQGSIWGWAVNTIVENKGYSENWFWWGFFFGMLALLVALTKPDVRYYDVEGPALGGNYMFRGSGYEANRSDVPNAWRCQHCGKLNAGYVGTCGCGCDKSGNMPIKGAKRSQQNNRVAQPQILYCSSCGKQLEMDAKFCKYCGVKIEF